VGRDAAARMVRGGGTAAAVLSRRQSVDGRGRGGVARHAGADGNELRGCALVAVLQGRGSPVPQRRERRPGFLHHGQQPPDPGRSELQSRSGAVRAVAVAPVLRAASPRRSWCWGRAAATRRSSR
jgi:hypothetical protein